MTPNISKVLSGILLKTFLISSVLIFLSYQIINSRHSQSLESKQSDFIDAIAGVFLDFNFDNLYFDNLL